MHPVADDRMAERPLGLRDLVLVVREDVVDTARVQIEALAEVLRAHRRTLDVPAREARAPWRVPHEGAPGLALLPEREVGGVALLRVDLDAHASFERFADVARQLPVAGEPPDGEIDGAVDRVCEAVREQPLDQRDHLGHVLGGAREVRRRQDPDTPLVLTERPLVAPRDLLRRLPFGERRGDHLVFPAVDRVLAHVADVGDVLHRGDLVAEAGERAAEPVGEEVRAEVPEVDGAVHRRPAGVHADLARALRAERDDLALQRVVDAELHQLPLCDRVRRLNGGRMCPYSFSSQARFARRGPAHRRGGPPHPLGTAVFKAAARRAGRGSARRSRPPP